MGSWLVHSNKSPNDPYGVPCARAVSFWSRMDDAAGGQRLAVQLAQRRIDPECGHVARLCLRAGGLPGLVRALPGRLARNGTSRVGRIPPLPCGCGRNPQSPDRDPGPFLHLVRCAGAGPREPVSVPGKLCTPTGLLLRIGDAARDAPHRHAPGCKKREGDGAQRVRGMEVAGRHGRLAGPAARGDSDVHGAPLLGAARSSAGAVWEREIKRDPSGADGEGRGQGTKTAAGALSRRAGEKPEPVHRAGAEVRSGRRGE